MQVPKIRDLAVKNIPQPILRKLFPWYTIINGTRWKRLVIFRQWLIVPRNPTTYAQKLKYKMTFDRRDILTQFADKLTAREIVRERFGEKYLSQIYQIADWPNEIDWSNVPAEFVCKVNHMSGGNILVWNGAPLEAKLPKELPALREKIFQIRPESLDQEALDSIVSSWLQTNYAWIPGRSTYEWAYENIKPKVYLEEFLYADDGTQGLVFRFHVFNGKVRTIRYPINHTTNEPGASFTPDWEFLNVTFKGRQLRKDIPKPPPNLLEMISIAEEIGSLVDYVRVDLYDLGSRVVLSELTNYPKSGKGKWTSKAFDLELGSYWNLVGYRD